jgi:putative toxin-antitoxin system antitoxin component (TIGR02293 family)
MSNEIAMRDDTKNKSKNGGKEAPPKTKATYSQKASPIPSTSREAAMKYGGFADKHSGLLSQSFKVSRGGIKKEYTVHTGYGYFIPSLQKAENMLQVAQVVEEGLQSAEIGPILDYLGFKVSDIAKAASVSASTVSRWHPKTSIGIPGSNQFFRIDQVIRKGVDLFGGLEELKGWLQSPNLALGNAVPAQLITTAIGVELVDEALDALHYGNVM